MEVLISLLYPWDRPYFPKMTTVIAPILHDLTVWLWSRHASHQGLGLFPHPHILNIGRHLWRPQTTECDVMILYYFWHRSSYCQVLLPYFLGILTLGIHLLCCHEPKSLTETPLTHQLVKNSWCLSNILTSFSNFKIFLYTSRDYLTKWSQKEKDSTMWCHLYVESKRWLKWTYLQNRNRLMDTENKIVVAKGTGGGERDGMGGWG